MKLARISTIPKIKKKVLIITELKGLGFLHILSNFFIRITIKNKERDMQENKSVVSDSFFKEVIKGIIISLIIIFLSVLAFALIIKITSLTDKAIKPVNQFIKVIAILLGCVYSIRLKGGLIKGLFIGLIATLVSYFAFGFLSGGNLFGLHFVLELIFGVALGIISGIIAVNLKK